MYKKDDNLDELKDDVDIKTPPHLRTSTTPANATKKLSELIILDYLMSLEDSIGDPLFIKVFPPSLGSIEVVFYARRYREIAKLSTLINGELARKMNSRSIDAGFLNSDNAIQDAAMQEIWRPFQLAKQVHPTQLPESRRKYPRTQTQQQSNSTPSFRNVSTPAPKDSSKFPPATNPYNQLVVMKPIVSAWRKPLQHLQQGHNTSISNTTPEMKQLQDVVAAIQAQIQETSISVKTIQQDQVKFHSETESYIRQQEQRTEARVNLIEI